MSQLSESPHNETAARAAIAAVVLSVRAPVELPDAVRSLLSQDPVPEVVVVNSGGENAAALLARNDLPVEAIEYQEVLFPGAARNAGIAATRAPVIAFLASDCLAQPGWSAARLARHRAGHPAVASALVNSHPCNLFACAAHIANFATRLPVLPKRKALRYGASYNRSLFTRYGRFREDLRTGEDTEFHARFGPRDKPIWAPEIRTLHRNPTSLSSFVADQFQRGWHAAQAYGALGGPSQRSLLINSYRRVLFSQRIARCYLTGSDRRLAAATWMLLPITTLAYACGVLHFGLRRRRYREGVSVSRTER